MKSPELEYELMPGDIVLRFGKNVKELRLKKKLTQAQLGLLCDPPMLQQNVAEYEKGHLAPSLKTGAVIAKALRVDIKELL